MESYKNQIIERGYNVILEMENGISFVNEDTKFCVILVKDYDKNSHENFDLRNELHNSLKKLYLFAEKSTICIIIDGNEDKETIMRNEYHYLKIFTEHIGMLPSKSNKDITITFSPMENQDDVGDYNISPYEYFDGLCSFNYISYLSTNAKNGDMVKTPKVISNSYFRYLCEKLYRVENIGPNRY